MVDLIENLGLENLQPYQAGEPLHFIAKGKDIFEYYKDEAKPLPWPKELPKRKELLGEKQEVEI